jgi:hypothetical protein
MGGYAHLDRAALEPLQLTSGLSLLGEVQGDSAMARFAVRRGDGEVVRLSRLPYLVTVAIAEGAMASGALGRGVRADLVAAEVSSQSGQEVTAAGVRALVVGHLAPLGIVILGSESPPPAKTPSPLPVKTPIPAPAGPAVPAPAEAAVPAPAEPKEPVQAEAVTPVQAETVTPVQAEAEGLAPAEAEGPVEAEAEGPAPAETEEPAPAEAVSPVEAEAVSPVRAEAEGLAPAEMEDSVQAEAAVPAPAETEDSVQAEAKGPAPAEMESPVQAEAEGPAAAETEGPAPPRTEGPVVPWTESPAPAGPAGEQRRVGRPRRRTVVLGAVGLLVVAAGATAAVVAVTRPGSPAKPAAAPAAANQARAVAWVAQQVSSGTMVSCDATTCGQLRRSGFPGARLMTLGSATQDPLGSALVVATPAVRSEFGAQLASVYAPLMIADFGSGANRVEVRTTAPDGPAVFAAELKTQQASLRSAGQQLLRNRTVQASPAARADLLAGRVDLRLLANLSVLSSQQTIKLVAFGDASPGASSAVPLRSVQLSATSAKDRAAILDFLRAQKGAYRPDSVSTSVDRQGQPVVTARFDAPAPLPAP